MNLNKLFIVFTGGLILTHAVNSLMIGTPLIGIIIWSFPLAIFFYKHGLNQRLGCIKYLALLS